MHSEANTMGRLKERAHALWGQQTQRASFTFQFERLGDTRFRLQWAKKWNKLRLDSEGTNLQIESLEKWRGKDTFPPRGLLKAEEKRNNTKRYTSGIIVL